MTAEVSKIKHWGAMILQIQNSITFTLFIDTVSVKCPGNYNDWTGWEQVLKSSSKSQWTRQIIVSYR